MPIKSPRTFTFTEPFDAKTQMERLYRFLRDDLQILGESFSEIKTKITEEGGVAVRIVNGTGAASVKGSVVSLSTSADNTFILQANEYDAIGVVYESGVANGDQCWVVISGIAEVLLKNGTAATHGNWVKSADTDGRAVATTGPSGLGALTADEHFREIGHCMESKTAGTDVLAKCVLHFN